MPEVRFGRSLTGKRGATAAASRALPAALAVAALLVTAACGSNSSHTAAPPVAGGIGATGESTSSPAAQVGAPSPAGTYTGIDGRVVDVASLRGKPTVLWFIAAGCSSCTASIPALADHLAELHADGVQVKVIDLYGDLGHGPKAAAALTKLGRALTGNRFADPTWKWGISSKNLSFRYDNFGEPDVYYILDRTGKITYRGGVPVSTMDALLAKAHDAASV